MSKKTIRQLLSWPPPQDKSVTGEQISPEEERADRKMQIAINYENEKARRDNGIS